MSDLAAFCLALGITAAGFLIGGGIESGLHGFRKDKK